MPVIKAFSPSNSCSKKMTNDRKEKGTHRACYSPAERNMLNITFFYLESAELAVRCGSVPPAWPGVPVTFTLTSGCSSAAAQNCKPSQVKTDLATQSSWCGLCPPAHRGQHELAQKANRAPDCLESRMGGGEEQDGCFGGQVSLQSQRNQHPGPKVVCDEFFHQFGGRVRESSVILGKRCRKLRR